MPRKDGAPLILVADDEQMVRDLLAKYLGKAGYNTVTASDGREALFLFRKNASRIRLVVTDVDMPLLDGVQLADLVTAGGTGCPVILISGKPLPEPALERGWKFLPKPFLPDVLLAAIAEVLHGEAHANRERPKVVIAEDDAEVRRRLYNLLRYDYDVVATFPDGQGVLEEIEQLHPEMVLLDIGMPGLNGFAVAKQLRVSMPAVPLVFVTQHLDPAYLEEALRAGVAGYVLKRNAATELKKALQRVRSGGRYISPGVRVRTQSAGGADTRE